MATKYGFNVYAGQGAIDWNQVVANGGKDFALIRAGFDDGTVGWVDSRWIYNASECNRLNFPIGAWWFCYAYTRQAAYANGVAAARAVLDNNITLTYPLYYDLEDATFDEWRNHGVTPTTALVHDVVAAWCNGVASKGITPGLYFNWNTYSTWSFQTLLANNPSWSHWIAQWSSTAPSWETWDFWQYSSGDLSTNMIPGIQYSVDLDVMADGYVPPTPPTPPGPYPTPTLSNMPIWLYLKPHIH